MPLYNPPQTPLSVTTKGDLQTYSTTPARLAVGSDGKGIIANSSATNGIQWADITNSFLSRQALINGNFDVWQRGTSGTTFTDGVGMFVADHWYDSADDDGGTKPTITRSRQLLISGDISNAFYYSRLAMDGAGTSLGVNSWHVYIQKVEHGVRNLCGLNKSVTVSFWARSDIVNKRICPTLRQNYGTGGSPSSAEVIKGTPITLTTSWVKYTATFTTNTLVGKTFGTDLNDYLGLFIYYEWGTTWGNTYVETSVTAETYGNGYIDIAQVQLCAGDVALPFMPKSYEEELKQCERYCESIDGSTGRASSETAGLIAVRFRQKKYRNIANGDIIFIGTDNNCSQVGVAARKFTSGTVNRTGINGCELTFTGASGMTEPNLLLIYNSQILVSVEL